MTFCLQQPAGKMTVASPATATLRFGYPDLSVPDEARSMFTLPAPRDIVNVDINLIDFGQSPDVVHGGKGLDVQGFSYIKHHSSICDGNRVISDRNTEDVYFPEIRDLVCRTTGASKAIVVNCAVRQALAVRQEDHSFVPRKGGELDQSVANLPRDIPPGEMFAFS